MEMYAHPKGTEVVLVVSGRVTAEDAPTLKDRLLAELEANTHHLIVDLSRIEFMGSAGLGALITAVKAAKSHGGNLTLAAPSAVVMTLLNVSGLLNFVSHTPSV